MLTLNDGRTELWQWDTSRKLTVDADCSQVHFSNKVFGRSIDVDVVDGVAIIPDILLQTDKDLTAWAFVGTAKNGYTKISKVFNVNRRNKPADYVFTPPEQATLGQIMERLDDLEAMQDPNAIKNAVDEYLDNNPIQIDEKDPTVHDWAKQTKKPKYTATEVGAVATVNGVKPDANGNVKITIPDSGGNVELDTTLTQSGKAADAKAVGDAIKQLSDGNAEPYTLPVATADTLGGVKVGEGLQMDGDVLRVVPEGMYELIETITIVDAGMRKIERQQTPQGQEYNFSRVIIEMESKASETDNITFATTIRLSNSGTLYDYTTNAIRKNYASVFRCWVNMWADGSRVISSLVGGVKEETISANAIREYIGVGTIFDRVVGVDMTALADIPTGTVIKIWGVRA